MYEWISTSTAVVKVHFPTRCFAPLLLNAPTWKTKPFAKSLTDGGLVALAAGCKRLRYLVVGGSIWLSVVSCSEFILTTRRERPIESISSINTMLAVLAEVA